MVPICLCRMSDQREGWKWLWKGKIKHVGETILSFDMSFSQHPSVCLDRGRWPNITFHQSYLNDREMLLDKGWGFFPSHSPSNVSFCLDSHRLTEPSGGVRKEKTKEPEVTVVEVEKQEQKSQPAF